MNDNITMTLVSEAARANHVHKLFGIGFPLRVEPTVFNMARLLAADYNGGVWQFYALSNGGFFMAPDEQGHTISCENGFEGRLSAEAFGITVCLYAYSHLSFGGDALAEVCAEHYHLLREFALGHPEVGAITAACD